MLVLHSGTAGSIPTNAAVILTLAYWSCRASELSGEHPWVDTGILGLSRVRAQWLAPLGGLFGHWHTGVVARQSSVASTLAWVEYLDTGMLGLSRVGAQWQAPMGGIFGHWHAGIVTCQSSTARTLAWNTNQDRVRESVIRHEIFCNYKEEMKSTESGTKVRGLSI